MSGVCAANAAAIVPPDREGQIAIGTPLDLLFIAAGLLFDPTVFGLDGRSPFTGGDFGVGFSDFRAPVRAGDGPFDFFDVSGLQGDPTTETGQGLTPAASATPLPATLPLFATGLGVLGLLGWRRKRKAGAALA